VAWITPQHQAGSVAYLWCVVQRFPSRKSMAHRDSTCRLAGEVKNTLFFGRAETQERLILWAHDCDHDAMMKSLENTPITVRQFLGGNGLYDPEEKYPELNQRFADHLRSNPNRASAVNEENRENFSDEKPDMSMAMCMMGDPEKLAGRSYWEVESQAALNETEVFSRKSKGAISFAVEDGRDVAFGLSGHHEMTSAPAKNPFYKHGIYAKTSVTDSELRFLYRNRNNPEYQERVKFYREDLGRHFDIEFSRCDPPWEQEAEIWQQYRPKSER
ncbi:hypothetical protein, partial [Xanthomonas campestris]